MNDDILSVYIGNDDVMDWAMITGKDIIMPELLRSCEYLLYNELEEVKCMNLFAEVASTVVKVEFIVKPIDVNNTLSKILEWAEQEEEYELCARTTTLQDYVNGRV